MLQKIKLLRWSLRKLALPIGLSDLVIEVGSGGNPHPASDVLAEKFMDSSHRLRSIKIDRELVLADACKMPFVDDAFDYSIAFHVLEHVAEPAYFIGEMSRISKAGYIETPNVIYERLFPLDVHLLEVAISGGKLLLFRKPDAIHDRMLQASNLVENDTRWASVFSSRPELFHVCHKWKGKIEFEVLNPSQSLDWHQFPESGLTDHFENGGQEALEGAPEKLGLRQIIISAIRWFYRSFASKKIDIESILVCPECKNSLTMDDETYSCAGCATSYRRKPIRDFTKPIVS